MSKALEQFIKEEYTSREVPDFRVGDIVKVYQIVPDVKVEKKLSKTAKAIKKSQKEDKGPAQRIQIFEGVVIAKKHGREPGASFTVRKIASHNIGVEKTFPLYSPLVKKVEVVSRPTKKVRRAKLYFLRDRIGKKARRLGVGTAVEQGIVSVEEKPADPVTSDGAGATDVEEPVGETLSVKEAGEEGTIKEGAEEKTEGILEEEGTKKE